MPGGGERKGGGTKRERAEKMGDGKEGGGGKRGKKKRYDEEHKEELLRLIGWTFKKGGKGEGREKRGSGFVKKRERIITMGGSVKTGR